MVKRLLALGTMAVLASALLGLIGGAAYARKPQESGSGPDASIKSAGTDDTPGKSASKPKGTPGESAGKPNGTGGRSENNPDGGGVDKPYSVGESGAAEFAAAGSQGPPYHDGNNGCGQDKKSGEPRETGTARPGWDDNNGWCGKPEAEPEAEPPGPGIPEAPAAPTVVPGPVRVLDVKIVREAPQPPSPVTLPVTGVSWIPLTLIALSSVGVGFALQQKRQEDLAGPSSLGREDC